MKALCGAEAMEAASIAVKQLSCATPNNSHSSNFKFLSGMLFSLSKHIHDWMFTSVWRARGLMDAQSLPFVVRRGGYQVPVS